MHLKKRWIDRRVYEYFAVNIAPLLKWGDPVLIYQMGKVGSSSIRNSLFRCREPQTRLVLMSHEFLPVRNRDPDRIFVDPEHRQHLMREIDHNRRVYHGLSPWQRLGLRFRERFYSERIYHAYVAPGRRLRVITLVREPVANNISMFFQVMDEYTGRRLRGREWNVDALIDVFLQHYMHARPLLWFDAELRTMLGIDVFAHPFPTGRGYGVVSTDRIDLLVLKCEISDDVKAGAIADFLNLGEFTIVRSNRTRDKPYAHQYDEFKRRIRLPVTLLDELYESKFAKHFYSDEERHRWRTRWLTGRVPGGDDSAGPIGV